MDVAADVLDFLSMHTSAILQARHFEYHGREENGATSPTAGFEALCPDYHALDRLGIVAVPFEAGLQHTALAVLAWTTAFYDSLRAEHPEGFFNYPQHYVFYATDNDGMIVTQTDHGTLTDEAIGSWGHLDIWPDCKRVETPNSVSGVVQALFGHEINRLLWPRSLSSADCDGEARLPQYARRMLRTRLKAVYLYNSDSPTVEIHAAEPVVRLKREACEQAGLGAITDSVQLAIEAYEHIDIDQFLETFLGSVFEES